MIVPSELTIDINYKDEVITSISEQDAIWMNATKENLAKITERGLPSRSKNTKQSIAGRR